MHGYRHVPRSSWCCSALVFAGVHIAVALGITAALGIYLMAGRHRVVRTFVANTAYEALRDYVFAVIPLFMLMGDFLAKCGAARDLYTLANRLSRWLPARLAVATIISNALFAFVTGVSIAAAAAFSRIAYPEMMRYGYRPRFRARLHRRQRLPRHADPALGADDRLGRADRVVDRQAVPRRRACRGCSSPAAFASMWWSPRSSSRSWSASRAARSRPLPLGAAVTARRRRRGPDEEPIGPLLASTGAGHAADRRRARRHLARRSSRRRKAPASALSAR